MFLTRPRRRGFMQDIGEVRADLEIGVAKLGRTGKATVGCRV